MGRVHEFETRLRSAGERIETRLRCGVQEMESVFDAGCRKWDPSLMRVAGNKIRLRSGVGRIKIRPYNMGRAAALRARDEMWQ